jgi:hypothetical protein
VEDDDAQGERSRQSWIRDEVETEALNVYLVQFKYYYASRLYVSLIQKYKASHDVVPRHLLRPDAYTNHNAMHIVHNNTTCIVHKT